MPFRQPPVPPLPADLDLSGQTVVVTGASSGIGLEICRQLLERCVGALIMAVRDNAKGEAVKTQLLAEGKPTTVVEVMTLDVSSYKSIKQFTRDLLDRHARLDMLLLNAGISPFTRIMTDDGHESTLQVNYLSNALLLLDLLPALEATAAKTNRPSRVSITGSRMYETTGLATSGFPITNGVLEHLDAAATFSSLPQYANSKLLAMLMVREVGQRYDSNKVIVNIFCPGMVSTNLAGGLPVYVRAVLSVIQYMRARTPETAASIALHAACVAGKESHGKLLGDKELHDDPYVGSEKCNELQKNLWKETIDEMAEYTSLPEWA